MSHALAPLVQFTGGEWSPQLDNRIDLEGYRNAGRRMRNVIVTKQGGVTRRPGTQWCGLGKQSLGGGNSVSRLQKFQYAPGTAFMLEFCDLGVRFWQGGTTPTQIVMTAGTTPAWVTGTNYPAGSFVHVGSSVYYLYSGTNGAGTALINSTTSPGSDLTHWNPQTAYEVPLPYSGTNFTAPDYWAADVFVLQCLQINDVVYIVHPNFPVWKLTRFGNTNWVSQAVQFLTPAMLDENVTDETISATSLTTSNVGAGSFTPGTTYTISFVGTTNFVAIGASSNAVGITFVATGAGSGSGVAILNTGLNAAAGQNWGTGVYYTPGNTVAESGLIYSCAVAHTSGVFLTDLANGLWTLVTTFQAGHVGSYWQLAYNRPASYIQALATGSTAAYTLPTVSAGQGGYTLPLVGTWEVQTYGTWQGIVTIIVSYDNGVSWQNIVSLTSMGDANFSITGQELSGGIYGYTIASPSALASSTPPRIVLTADNQFVYGLVQITAVFNAYQAAGLIIVPLFATTA